MACNNKGSNEKFFSQQEHRQISRLWRRAIERMSSSRTNLEEEFGPIEGIEGIEGVEPNADQNQGGGPRKDQKDAFCVEEGKTFPSEVIQKKLLKGKSTPKIKSPLQKFDEIVTKELTNRRMMEEGGIGSFEDPRKWSTLQFTMSDYGRGKVSLDKKVSRGVLYTMEKETLDSNPSEGGNAALLEAIDKLAQAQAFCRFEAAVKAAEAATAAVPPELAEEVAVQCAKDYQFEIVDVINEKIPLLEERKPIEVIGYIGMTKLKENL